MGLAEHAIWWQVYPLGAVGAPIRADWLGAGDPQVTHRLPLLEGWLDYAVQLGCSGLLLGPVFASASHGYDTLDHFRIDPRLGDEQDFDRLVRACSDRGMSVMLDGVFNHVGNDHPLVAQSLAEAARGGGGGNGGGGTHPVKLDWIHGSPRARGWEGHGDLAELDHSDPRVHDLVADVMLHWLRQGIAGWRLDVAYAVPPAFWRDVLARVRSQFPDAFFLGEVIHGDYTAVADAGTLDAVTQYELWKAIWSSLLDRNFWELASALERHAAFSRSHVMQTFVGNHDVSRIASLVGDDGAALAVIILMTVPGMPSIYYGDEQAFRGTKGDGWAADDAVRPPLPAHPEDLAPYGAWMHKLHRQLIGLRRRYPWIATGDVRVVAKDNRWISYETTGAAGQRVRVRLDLEERASARIEVDGAESVTWRGRKRRA